jgi:two-component system chemotaxis response regulator CheV
MSKKEELLDEALRRTNLSSSNQMEMLTFRLRDNQLYGINVFKIIEIVECPEHLTSIPYSHPAAKGVVSFRGDAVTVIDLAEAIDIENTADCQNNGYLVICEYSRQLNAFLISQPEFLLTRGWDEIVKPDGFNAKSLVAIAYTDTEEMVLLLDIEEILADVISLESFMDQGVTEEAKLGCVGKKVLLLDDSNSAMLMLTNLMDEMGIESRSYDNAPSGLSFLREAVGEHGVPPVDLIISDIEMPEMDGFTFARTVRSMTEFSRVPIILHSSMSNPTNQLKAQEAGADHFIAKFNPTALSTLVMEVLEC